MFAAGNAKDALAQYTAALRYVDEDLLIQVAGAHLHHTGQHCPHAVQHSQQQQQVYPYSAYNRMHKRSALRFLHPRDPLCLSHRQVAKKHGPLGLSADTPHAVHARAARAPLLLNVAACQLREQAYAAATDAATEVLHLASEDSGGGRVDGAALLLGKAHFRRAAARRALNQTSSAIEDLKEAQRLCACAPYVLSCLNSGCT